LILKKSNFLKNEKTKYHQQIREGIVNGISTLKRDDSIEHIIIPNAGNVILAKFYDEIKSTKNGISNSHDLFQYIVDSSKILVSPGHIFKLPQEELWFRVTVSTKSELFNEKLKNMLSSFD
jgi:aspartate/methionine/tyrosine aminotransferase